jgi:type II secretory pathway pseudopilin PulG
MRHHMHRFFDQRGMTLVEILIAAAVLMVALVGLASGIPIASYGIQEGSQLTTATFLANQRLEQVKAAAWTSTPGPDTLGVGPTAAPVGTLGITFPDETPMANPYTQYTRQVRITDCGVGLGCGGSVLPDLRQVTITVSYIPLTGVGVGASAKSAIVTMLVTRR